MEQIAVVKKVLENGMAQVSVERGTACGAAHSCADCAGCEHVIVQTEKVVNAFNDVSARTGDIVRLRSENAPFMKSAAIVYLLPLALALVVYGVASALFSLGEGPMMLFALLGFVLGILIAVAWDRHMKKVGGLRFHIVEVKKACSGM
jgi:sigma-E factor negative regulatory protein RseC